MDDFYKTQMGRKFYECDFPELTKQLKRIADALEKREAKKWKQDEKELLITKITEKLNEAHIQMSKEDWGKLFKPIADAINEMSL